VDFDFWPSDVIALEVPSVWTAPSSPTCESVDVAATTNVFKSTDDTTTLDCVTDGSWVLVYGMTKDIDISEVGGTSNNLDLKLKVSSFTAPIAKFTSFDWKIEILRAKTYNIIKKYSGSNKPDLVEGAITISSWTSSNGFPTQYYKQGVPLYMTTTLTTQNPIPNGGVINVVYTDTLTDSGMDTCYMVHSSASCAITGGKTVVITIANTDGVPAGSFTFYTLNTFDVSSTTASITSATSKRSSNGENIDKTAAAT
jgi:hypothetical protein